MKNLLSALVAVSVALASVTARAAGYNVDTQDAASAAQASAVTADISNASAVYYNPAGLAQGEKLQAEIGITPIIPSFSFAPANGGPSISTSSGVVTPIQAYLGWGISQDLSVGVGLFNDYGSAITWPQNDANLALNQLIVSTALTTFTVNPEVAFRLMDRLRVGLGVQVVRGTVDLKQSINFPGESTGTAEIGGGAWGVGGNVGIQYEILPRLLSVGAAYRSSVPLNFTGQAHFSNVPAEYATTTADQTVSTSVVLPDTVNLGIAVHPMEALRIGVDADYFAWQDFNELAIQFENPALDTTQRKNWHYAWNFHIGGEYAVTKAIRVRAGFLYDPSPAPAANVGPDLPDSTRENIALGVGYAWKGFNFDLGYQLVLFNGVTSTNPALPGKYSGSAQLIALSVSYTLDLTAEKPVDVGFTPASTTPAPAPTATP